MITSIQNTRVKEWNKLKKRKGRKQTGSFLVEGFHLVEEAYNGGWEVREVILREDVEAPDWLADTTVTEVSNQVFSAIADTETPQGIAAVIALRQEPEIDFGRVLMVDAVQDPGNLGTLIRTADAAGYDAVILGNGTVDPYNDKVIRATQGSIFHIPILQGSLTEWTERLKADGVQVVASALEGAQPYNSSSDPQKTALIVGNEGAGISPELLEIADERVYIPIRGKAESLNVAVAAGILMYHFID
ncbi:TrmH family RNA methyltransferase [Thalassobacillus hwangdonensis]|uniref:TrmH family RNA methyltransferase n=1 Tax=Thalassobacillus hwangdonensis TaxID=546108 RepID=A0ABW3L0D2_9BACI